MAAGVHLCSGTCTALAIPTKAMSQFFKDPASAGFQSFPPGLPCCSAKQVRWLASREQVRHSHSEPPQMRLNLHLSQVHHIWGLIHLGHWTLDAGDAHERSKPSSPGWPCKMQEVHPISLT